MRMQLVLPQDHNVNYLTNKGRPTVDWAYRSWAARWWLDVLNDWDWFVQRPAHHEAAVNQACNMWEDGPDTHWNTGTPSGDPDILPCAWVTPSGRWIGVRYGYHGEFLSDEIHGATYAEVERRGWIHAGGCSEGDCPRHDGQDPTPQQIMKLRKFGYKPRRTIKVHAA